MIQTLKNAWKVEDVRKRLIFTFLMLVIYRLGNVIPVPFIDSSVVEAVMTGQDNYLLQMLNTFAGGSLQSMSIFALSIYPYITASIVMQLLTIAIPRLEEMARDGEEGKRKMGKYTKVIGVVLALVQAYAIVMVLFGQAVATGNFLSKAIMLLTLVAGTMFLVWLGEMITEKGVGNGISIIIFFGIISGVPNQIKQMFAGFSYGQFAWWAVAILALISVVILVIVIEINQGERRIPVQYAKRVVGRKMYGGQSTHIPVKVNMSGVMPVIFSNAILQLPQLIISLFGGSTPKWMEYLFGMNTISGLIIYCLVNLFLIIVFAYFYSAVQFNTVEYAKNLQQYGGFIPGIRPGKPTGEYLQRISSKITLIGAVILAIIATAPFLVNYFLKLNMLFAGTSLIIVVGVILETIKQIESMLTMRHYKGFLNK
ncbi:preprotein translocase subunit SecY [Miniphocaeibacter halophilus]|uniref:Preprotein translocase subunit SecY n=1 Tax=Miniphocaeibacter halophilus TaxID=2931922 RepID=A0AC61MRK6_9FIRM|nr:preprotein translocase subunit SecY [Miniphocaeibacter halophilus]QQK07066.1 preprotein translocase subunit SecY [Miniphocaeibacter halophilus]